MLGGEIFRSFNPVCGMFMGVEQEGIGKALTFDLVLTDSHWNRKLLTVNCFWCPCWLVGY